MGRFYPLYIRRSDGKLETTFRGVTETNAPSKEQLDQAPDKNGISDFYREVPLDEAKNLDWRRKLGGMLARELGKEKANDGGSYILAALPENYRLYEHIKRVEKDGKTEVKSKTHAGGAGDRHDAYLYGHPSGKRKRFRSPNDFFPHVLWLCTDESGDPDNCTCKLCSPDDLECMMPAGKLEVKRSDNSSKMDLDSKVKPESGLQKVGATSAPASAASSKQPPTLTSQSAARPSTMPRPLAAQLVSTSSQMTQQQPSGPSPLPAPLHRDQMLDRQYRGFMYRAGELVWFQRGQAWGLGAVLRRFSPKANQYHYEVQPLSYPGHVQPPMVKTTHTEMRPWLAWSVPKYTNESLNRMSTTYQDADWQGILGKRYGNGDMEVDASILAAKAIDCSYSLFNEIETIQIQPDVTERHYRGIFLGAEKIWLGEPVRMVGGSNTDVLVIQQISEQTKSSQPARSVQFTGDIYRLATVAHANPQIPTPAAPRANPNLPVRMTEDLAIRNSRSINMKQVASYWGVISLGARVEMNQIKGRWYEASILLPVLLPQFDDMMNKGEVSEASLWMNARGDCLNTNRPPDLPKIPRVTLKHATRRETLGKAVPPNVQILDGTEISAG